MGCREGSIKNISDEAFQTEATKIWILFDLVFFVIVGFFAFIYVQMTPFSGGVIGFFGFVFMVIACVLCFLFLNHIGKKKNESIFSRYDSFRVRRFEGDIHVMLAKSQEGNDIILGICFVLIWVVVLIYAPGNVYRIEFRPNVISWLDQGRCDEIKKYDEDVASFCSVMTGARKNVSGLFMVKSKNLTANAVGCTYMLQSDNSGVFVVTNKPQACDIVPGQKVFIGIHPYIFAIDRGNGDRYSYSLEASLTQ